MAGWPLLISNDLLDAVGWRQVVAALEAMPQSPGRDDQLDFAREWLRNAEDFSTPEKRPVEGGDAVQAPDAP